METTGDVQPLIEHATRLRAELAKTEQQLHDTIRAIHAHGVDAEILAQMTGLPIEEIRHLLQGDGEFYQRLTDAGLIPPLV